MAALRLVCLGDGRPHGWLDVGRLGGATLGHQHVTVPEPELAVVGALELERGVERRRRTQRDVRGTTDVAGDQPARVAPVRAGRRAVEATGDENAARHTVTGERAAT